ncbi:MAG: hypothetical protein AB1591_07015 [Pseudomonadota bacterium]
MDKIIVNTAGMLTAKISAFNKLSKHIDTVAIGSSHGDYGFDPAFIPHSFNFCLASQDLKHSLYLYKWLISNAILKNIVIFYSIFSPGFLLEKTNEKLRCVAYKKILHLDLVYDSDIENNFNKYDLQINSDADGNGFIKSNRRHFIKEDFGAERRAASHIKHAERGGQDEYLYQITKIASELKQRIVVVIPPARSDYRSFCQQTAEMIHNNLTVGLKTSGLTKTYVN